MKFEKPQIKEDAEAGDKREKFITSLRRRFKKAIEGGMVPAAALAFIIQMPGQIGYSKLEAEKELRQSKTTVEYIKDSYKVAAEGEMDKNKLEYLRDLGNKGMALISSFGEKNIYIPLRRSGPEREKETGAAAASIGIKMENAEKLGIQEEWVYGALEKLPPGWRKNIGEIRFNDQIEKLPTSYGTPKNWILSARTAYRRETQKTDLVFFRIPHKRTQSSFQSDFYHEAAHASDWQRSTQHSTDDSIRFAYAVLERIKSSERFYSPYVESIRNKDKQTETYIKTVEYWAEIAAQYFKDKSQLPLQDQRLVEDIINY